LDPRFAGSNPADGDGFLRGIKFCSMTSFGGEVKLAVPYYSILRHAKDPYSIKEILARHKLWTFLTKFLLLHFRLSVLITLRELWWLN
jgi:hypothetical protein